MTDPIAFNTGVAPTGTAQPVTSLGGLGSEAFLQLLVAQLRYQNPMEPTDGTQFLQQTAQFTQVETLQQLAESQQSLMNLTQFSLAVGLTGKTVEALTAEGNITGEVSGVRFTADGPELEVGDQWVPISSILEVASEPEAPSPPPSEDGTTSEPEVASQPES
jgi:flagellar basal-body rod modification protein FlgD